MAEICYLHGEASPRGPLVLWVEMLLLAMCVFLVISSIVWRTNPRLRAVFLLVAKLLAFVCTAAACIIVAGRILGACADVIFEHLLLTIASNLTIFFFDFMPVLCLTMALITILEYISRRGSEGAKK